MQINSSYCGEIEQNGPLVGTIPVESSPTLTFDNVHLTAVVTSVVDDQTVAFLGTSDGHLKKVGDQSYRFIFVSTRWAKCAALITERDGSM